MIDAMRPKTCSDILLSHIKTKRTYSNKPKDEVTQYSMQWDVFSQSRNSCKFWHTDRSLVYCAKLAVLWWPHRLMTLCQYYKIMHSQPSLSFAIVSRGNFLFFVVHIRTELSDNL